MFIELLKCADALDKLCFYKEADVVEKLAGGGYMLTRKKRNPLNQITNKIDALSGQVASLMNSQDSGGGEGEKTEITTEPTLEQGIEKVKFDIKQ